MLHVKVTALCVTEPALLLIEVLHCGDMVIFYLFSCDFDLDLVTFTYELDP